jgi:type I restriction enzyme S subunit
MTAPWPKVRLGEVVTERQERPAPGDIELGKIRVLAKIGFNEGKIELRNDSETKTGMILIRPGDFVISGINAAKGAIAIYDPSTDEPIAATIHYGSYIPNTTKVDVRFLWWLLRSNAFREILMEYVPGGIKTELKAKRLLPVPILLPPLPEQRRIVARIEALAGEIERARELRQQVIIEAEALIYSAMRAVRIKLLQSSYPQEALGSITKVTSGGTPSRDNPAFWNGSIPWVKTGELIDGDVNSTEEYITKAGMENSSAKLYPPQTVLVALYGQGQTRGRTGRLLIPATTNQACCAIFPNRAKLDPRFLQLWLRSLYLELREDAKGGAQPNWNGKMIKELKISLPLLEDQRCIVAELDALQAKMDKLKRLQAESAAELDALMPSILDRAFQGAS